MRNQILNNFVLWIVSIFCVSGIVYWFSWWEWVENAADGQSLTHTVWNSLVDGVVKKTGSVAETITWIKTFSSPPVVPSPTASGEVASKGYVDSIGIGAGSKVLLQTQNASNDSVIDFTQNGGIDFSAYDEYVIKIIGLVPSSDSNSYVDMRVSTNGGTSFDSTTGNYWRWEFIQAGGTAAPYSTSDNKMAVSNYQPSGNVSGENSFYEITVLNPSSSSSLKTLFRVEGTNSRTDGYTESVTSHGRYNPVSAVTGIRIYFRWTNIQSGVFKIYGIK